MVPSFYPAHYFGGPTESVYNLCRAVARTGAEVRVLTTDTNGPESLPVDTAHQVELEDGVRVRYCHRIGRVSVSPTLLWELKEYLSWADLVHLTAVYSFPTIPTLTLAKAMHKPVVWSPRGSLQRWDRTRRLAAKSIWEKACALAAPATTVLHTTSAEEAQASAERMRPLRAVIIPNGVTIPDSFPRIREASCLRLLHMGRLDPQKGIERLLGACKRLVSSGMPVSLKIVGSGEATYTEALTRLVSELGLTAQVRLLGHLTGHEKEQAFATSDLLVLASFRENFGMVVAEALARGIPVIASKGTPWQRLDEVGCGTWVDNDEETLARAIQTMSNLPLADMGCKGRAWMCREFSWDSSGHRMLALYDELCSTARQQDRTP